MNEIKTFTSSENLFKVNGYYVCVSDKKVMDENNIPFYDSLTNNIRSNRYLSLDGCVDIIFSTKFIHESIPVLDIEGELPSIGKAWEEVANDYKNHNHGVNPEAFRIGYKKAKETFKYTEEDLKNAINLSRSLSKHQYSKEENDQTIVFNKDGCGISFLYSIEEVLQEIEQPKEIKSIEVEYEMYGYPFHSELEPIILPNGKVKCKVNYF